MHIIIGGAYNGKRAYVEKLLAGQDYAIFDGEIPADADGVVVLCGFEQLVMNGSDEIQVATQIFEQVQHLQGPVYCICTDMGRGIVPIDRQERFMRDALGRLYQLFMQEAETVTRVWYGLTEKLK